MRRIPLALAMAFVACRASEVASTPPPGETSPAPNTAATSNAPEQLPPQLGPGALEARAQRLAHECIMLDGHIDVPWRLDKGRDAAGNVTEDISTWTAKGEFDAPRARVGGLDAPFMSIYVPAEREMNGAKAVADRLISTVESVVAKHPETFSLARSPADVRRNFSEGKISLPLGMENGAPIEGKLENLQHFYDRGVRYITLAHSEDNHISDSSYDTDHANNGLSAFGREVVREMNRLGIMVDVSHVSDAAFWHVLEVSQAPVIASHSSARHFTPGFERNLSDEMIEALAAKGGVVAVNFGSVFIDGDIRERRSALGQQLELAMKQAKVGPDSPKGEAMAKAFWAEHPPEYATLSQVADHIEHIIKVAGIDHVGFGSDFDGLGDMLPLGLKDVADYPNLIAELLRRGHDERSIHKICGENLLRVWSEVERVASKAPADR